MKSTYHPEQEITEGLQTPVPVLHTPMPYMPQPEEQLGVFYATNTENPPKQVKTVMYFSIFYSEKSFS